MNKAGQYHGAVELLFLWIMLLSCVGCAPEPQQSGDGYQVETVDDSGFTVRINGKPKRIVSLNLGTDEILVDLVPPERIAALSYLSGDAGLSSIVEQAAQIPVKLRERNAEAIVALRPDLVLMADSVPEEVRTSLREMGITVHVSHSPQSLPEVKQRVERIAKLVGEEDKGRQITVRMQEKLAGIKAKVDQIPEDERKVILAFSFSGAFGRADGMFHDLCAHAGVVNGAAKAGLKKNRPLSKEQIVSINPDVFLLPTWSSDDNDDSEAFRKEVRGDPAYRTVNAVAHDRLVFVSDRYRYCVSQYAADSVEQIAKAAYPALF